MDFYDVLVLEADGARHVRVGAGTWPVLLRLEPGRAQGGRR
jgi:hypothetical protein